MFPRLPLLCGPCTTLTLRLQETWTADQITYSCILVVLSEKYSAAVAISCHRFRITERICHHRQMHKMKSIGIGYLIVWKCMRICAVSMAFPWSSIWSMTILSTSEQEHVRYEIEQTKPWKHIDYIAFLSKAREKFSILDECFLALDLLNNSCSIPGLCLQENSSRANACKTTWPTQAELMQQLLCAQERTKHFFLFLKTRQSNWNVHQN